MGMTTAVSVTVSVEVGVCENDGVSDWLGVGVYKPKSKETMGNHDIEGMDRITL